MWKNENPVNWFEVPVTDMKRAMEFYEYVFGTTLRLNKMGSLEMAWFPMSENVQGATGTLIKSENHSPSQSGVRIYFSVTDIDTILSRVKEKGGSIINSKTDIGNEHGFFADFSDSEGNLISVHSVK